MVLIHNILHILMNVLNSKIWQSVHQKRQKISNFIFPDFGILLVCCLERVYLHKNPRNICVAICFGFTKKIFSLPRLFSHRCFMPSSVEISLLVLEKKIFEGFLPYGGHLGHVT